MTQQELFDDEARAVTEELAFSVWEAEQTAVRLLSDGQRAMVEARYTEIRATNINEQLVCRLGILVHALRCALREDVPWPWLRGFDAEGLVRFALKKEA